MASRINTKTARTSFSPVERNNHITEQLSSVRKAVSLYRDNGDWIELVASLRKIPSSRRTEQSPIVRGSVATSPRITFPFTGEALREMMIDHDLIPHEYVGHLGDALAKCLDQLYHKLSSYEEVAGVSPVEKEWSELDFYLKGVEEKSHQTLARSSDLESWKLAAVDSRAGLLFAYLGYVLQPDHSPEFSRMMKLCSRVEYVPGMRSSVTVPKASKWLLDEIQDMYGNMSYREISILALMSYEKES